MKRLMILSFMMIMGLVLVACDNQAITATQLNETEQATNVFTLEELSQYTGANGSTAYIAVNGIIYDVTNAFDNGMHQGIQLGGTDATTVFAVSPHSQALLDTLPVVGTLVSNNTITETTTETTSQAVTTTTEGTETSTSITTTEQTTQVTLPVFTLEELSQYSGVNGTTAYIAVYGVIYDVTNVFVNGMHQGMQLGGTNATGVFEASPHSMELLATLTIIGSLEGYDPIVITQDTTSTTSQNNGTTSTCDDDDDEYEDEYEDEHEDEHEENEYEYEEDGYELD